MLWSSGGTILVVESDGLPEKWGRREVIGAAMLVFLTLGLLQEHLAREK
jgi:hypothetical protein